MKCHWCSMPITDENYETIREGEYHSGSCSLAAEAALRAMNSRAVSNKGEKR